MGTIQQSVLGMLGTVAGATGIKKLATGQEQIKESINQSSESQTDSLTKLMASKEGKQAVDDAFLANRLHNAYVSPSEEGAPYTTSESYQDFEINMMAYNDKQRANAITNMAVQRDSRESQRKLIDDAYNIMLGKEEK